MSKYVDHINNTLSKTILNFYEDKKSGQEVIIINQSKLRDVIKILKLELGFDMLIDIICIDWKDKKEQRFEIDYLLYNTSENSRIHIKIALSDNDRPTIDSIYDLYGAANWAERECWDMMGIHFNNHPNLKRLLTWEKFEGHPLRKDYPLAKRQPIPELDEIV